MRDDEIENVHIEYKDIDLLWVSSHYDFHRDGICLYNGEVCRFNCIEELADNDDDEKIVCTIYALTPQQQKEWLRRKWLFETCVGYHLLLPSVQRDQRQSGKVLSSTNKRRLGCEPVMVATFTDALVF